jgi:hypothetical protein
MDLAGVLWVGDGHLVSLLDGDGIRMEIVISRSPNNFLMDVNVIANFATLNMCPYLQSIITL